MGLLSPGEGGCPLLGGEKCTITMRNEKFGVQVVLFSEGLLLEVPTQIFSSISMNMHGYLLAGIHCLNINGKWTLCLFVLILYTL